MNNTMNRSEGSGNVIFVSAEEFAAGPRHHNTQEKLSRLAIASIFDIPTIVESIAPVLLLPTALAERVPPMDEVLELLVETGIVSGIIEQLELTQCNDEAIEVKRACRELLALKYAATDIRDFVIEYVETIDPLLAEKAWMAVNINLARLQTVDIEVFASK